MIHTIIAKLVSKLASMLIFNQNIKKEKPCKHSVYKAFLWLRGPEPNRFAQRLRLCLHSWHVPKIVGRSYSSLTILTAAPRRHKLHIVRFRIVHENSLISLFLLFPKSLLDFSGTLLCSLHRPPDAVACVAPETRRSSVQTVS